MTLQDEVPGKGEEIRGRVLRDRPEGDHDLQDAETSGRQTSVVRCWFLFWTGMEQDRARRMWRSGG